MEIVLILKYSMPILQFLIGCITIYFTKKYYLKVMTDYTPNEKNKDVIDFSFDVGWAFAINCIFCFSLFIAIASFNYAESERLREEKFNESALIHYKSQLKNDVREELLYELINTDK